MSRLEDEERIVDELASYMKAKLRINSHKGSWENHTVYNLISSLQDEVEELIDAYNKYDNQAITLECADVANFCAMIVDIMKERR